MKSLYQGTLFIHYGQFYVDHAMDDSSDDEDYPLPDMAFQQAGKKQQNGICGAFQRGKLFLVTGSSDAIIDIQVLLHDSEPNIQADYGDIVEVSMEVVKPLMLLEWGESEGHALDIPLGSYRVRYSVQGMDIDFDDSHSDEDWEKPLEGQRYLLEFWQADSAPDAIVACSTETATYWHKEWGTGNDV